MRILAILLSPPFPATAGHRIRNGSLLRALKLEGHAVTMVAFASPEEIAVPARELAGLCSEFHLVPCPESSSLDRLRAVFGRKPYGAVRLATPAMQSLVREHLAKNEYDVMLCDDVYMAGNIPENNRLPVVLNKHDITCRIMRQFAVGERNPLKRLYALLEAAKIQRLEAALCASAQAVAVCSARDAELLRELSPAAKLFVVPNVMDIDKYAPATQGDRHSVLFVGAMDWLPNQDGVEFLVHDIFPLVRRLVPTAQVVLAGRNLRPFIARATVCVVPLRIGSGTRLKILEAAAMAKPIVSTTLGAEGLDLRNGEEIILEDSPHAFAKGIAMLLTDPSRAAAIGSAARRAVEQLYSIPALCQQLRLLLDSLEIPAAMAGRSQP